MLAAATVVAACGLGLQSPAVAQTSVQAAAVPAVPVGRVIVHWRDGVTRASGAAGGERLELLSSNMRLDGLRAGRSITDRSQVLTMRGLSSAQLVERLSRDPAVAAVEIDHRLKIAQTVPNDPRFAGVALGQGGPVVGQWYLRAPTPDAPSAINAAGGWALSTGTPAVVVAVLDTGVRFDHPDLLPVARGGNLLSGRDFIGADDATRVTTDGSASGGSLFATAADGDGRDADASDPGDFLTRAEIDANRAAFWEDTNDDGVPDTPACTEQLRSSWHGTQVAGLIAATTNNGLGIASVGRNVRLLPVRVLGKCGGYTSDIAAAMRWAAGLTVPGEPVNPTPARVLNLSLGGGTGACSGSRTLASAVADVTAAGAVVVVAAGNSNGQAVGRPANCPGAIAVGAVRHTGSKVGFSDLGPEIALMAPGGNCVNRSGSCLFPIASTTNAGAQQPVPGSEAYTDGRDFATGTSFSSPLVAGAAALLLSLRPELTPIEVRSALQAGARPFPVDPSLPSCQPPSAVEQDECNCNGATCGAGLLDVEGALKAPIASAGSGGGGLSLAWPLVLLLTAIGLRTQRYDRGRRSRSSTAPRR